MDLIYLKKEAVQYLNDNLTNYSTQDIRATTGFIENRWLPALKSGKYTQGQLTLRSGQGDSMQYCCLGVACDLINPEGWDEDGWQNIPLDCYPVDCYPDEVHVPVDALEDVEGCDASELVDKAIEYAGAHIIIKGSGSIEIG